MTDSRTVPIGCTAAVRRREGVGIALLDAVLERWPTGNVEVATFTADSPGGDRHAHSTSGSDSYAAAGPIQPRRRAEGLVFTSSVSGRLAAAGPR